MNKKEIKKDGLEILNINTRQYTTRLSKKFKNKKPYNPNDPKLIRSFIPGVIIDILVREGEEIKAGDDLLILDSMKMKNRIKSSRDGIVKKIEIKPGDKISKETVLIRLG